MTEQTNIPKPASPLPWREEDGTDLIDAEGGEVAFAYPNEGGGFVDERDALYAAWAANNALKLYEACAISHCGDVPTLLDRAAELLDANLKPRRRSFFTPHLRRAAKEIRAALKAARGEA